MKTLRPTTTLFLIATLVAGACLLGGFNLSARDAAENVEPPFPQVIEFELGASGFSAGDQITITAVHGDRKHLEPGGSYLVEGSYTLASADSADLALFCTSRGPSGPTPVQSGQRIKITRGTGTFHLYETNLVDGWLHVSFYADNSHSHGGVYFGEKGRDKTIMRHQDWFREFAVKSSDNPGDTGTGLTSKANGDLLTYLGNPVPPPANMDSRYDSEHLLKAFTAICRKADLVILSLAVDESEFPFLVYGKLDGAHPLPEKPVFEEQKGYTYGGSVRGSNGEGATYFAVNLVPPNQFPEDQEKACHRRLMLRLQMLADKAEQTETVSRK